MRDIIVYARAWVELYRSGVDFNISSDFVDAISEFTHLDPQQTEDAIVTYLGDDWRGHLAWSLRLMSGVPSHACSLLDALRQRFS